MDPFPAAFLSLVGGYGPGLRRPTCRCRVAMTRAFGASPIERAVGATRLLAMLGPPARSGTPMVSATASTMKSSPGFECWVSTNPRPPVCSSTYSPLISEGVEVAELLAVNNGVPRRPPTRASARAVGPRSADIKASLRITLVGAAALVGAALWWRRHPSACPYSQRLWVEAPHPFITRARLREALGEISGARALEVGPGTGYYSIPVAEWIGPAGRLDIFDLQREMLDHTLRRAEARGLANVTATQGDARSLPYDDASFDAAYLITVLGEIPDQHAALAELRRVLRPAGRLVVGELWGDPHVVPIGRLRERAAAAGLRFERRVGPRIGFFAAFTAPGDQAQTNPR